MRSSFYVLAVGFLFSQASWGVKVGDIAPDFKLKAVNQGDKQVSLTDVLKNHDAAVVTFVATKCPYSNAYNKRYNEITKTLAARKVDGKKPRKIAFLALNSNITEPSGEVVSHAKENDFQFPVLKDDNHKIADKYQAEKTPEVFLVAKQKGVPRVLYHGRIDDDTDEGKVTKKDLLVAVDEFLSGKKISRTTTKAFGCTIKRN